MKGLIKEIILLFIVVVLLNYTDFFLVFFIVKFFRNDLDYKTFYKYYLGVLLVNLFIPNTFLLYSGAILAVFVVVKGVEFFVHSRSLLWQLIKFITAVIIYLALEALGLHLIFAYDIVVYWPRMFIRLLGILTLSLIFYLFATIKRDKLHMKRL